MLPITSYTIGLFTYQFLTIDYIKIKITLKLELKYIFIAKKLIFFYNCRFLKQLQNFIKFRSIKGMLELKII